MPPDGSTGRSGVPYQPFVPILRRVQYLLERKGRPEHAVEVARLADLAARDSEEFLLNILDGSVWGGSGSLTDVVLDEPSLSGGSVEDDEEYQSLWMLSVVDELRRLGVRNARVEALRAAYEDLGSV